MRAHRWLALLPVIGMLGGVPFANRVEPYVFGLPFLLFWIVLWVVITSVVMGVVYALDRATLRALEDEVATIHSRIDSVGTAGRTAGDGRG
ncbi:MAG TPA: DUF3311 domain-containing protein [Gemmatimonadaceae bacterium]|nr:DUF3311 domain-containing protein [Gemmatimonadaceae bacterium]